MNELNFRLLIVPKENFEDENQKDALLSQVHSALQKCCLAVQSISFLNIKTSDEDYPEIEELVIQIQAKVENYNRKQKHVLYNDFCLKWKEQFYTLPYSYIVLYGNDSFVKSRKNHHTPYCNSFSFGVLPHNGIFCEYAKLDLNGDVDFYHDTRNINIRFREFDVRISYDNIRNVYVNINGNTLFLDLFNPPLIFRIQTVIKKYGDSYNLSHRNLNFQPVLDEDDLREILLFGEDYFINSPLIESDIIGRANILCLNFCDNVIHEIVSRIHYSCSEKSIYYSCISCIPKSKPKDPVLEQMHFGCAYLLTAMFRRNFTFVAQVDPNIFLNIRRIYNLSRNNAECLEKALIAVLSALDSGKIINFWHAVENQFQFYVNCKDEMSFKHYIVPAKCCLIRRIMLTPTRMLLWPPEIMYGNRVLRNFDSEYSLRVSFRDDNMSRLSFNANFADPGFLDASIKTPMTEGIHIASRHYQFLAWSNSQIRDHGVWMYAQDSQGRTSSHIRRWMGDFSHIHNVPKYMARMGQCFSQTEDTLSVPLNPSYVRTEKDIERGYDYANRKPYCFSDGIGKISSALAAKVHQALGHDTNCSAFQIRYGGYKGMLVVDPTLRSADIIFRESMKKFDSPQNIRLEIAKTSAPGKLQLNRPFITLLNFLGVRHRTFLKLQEEMLKNLTDMLFDETKAYEFLNSKTPSNLYNYKDISFSGIYLTTEPYFKALLLALHRHHIENLKRRANILIDPSKGRNMLGVLDETGRLQYGQVFVQYTKDISCGETTNETEILRREVLVTKNPCLFPGDVRKFQAVDVYELHHIVDCIVFPQTGPRPHPNEMAGSDLDGDEYDVIWDPDLIFYGPNRHPADFESMKSRDLDNIKVSDMINFLQEYIRNDQVGAIANAHLAHADNKDSKFLACDKDICLRIAKKFSIAVDFAKNGCHQHLDRNERPTSFPDFMEKTHGEQYVSNKALGKLYRICHDFESENQETSISYQNIEVDKDLIVDGWEKYKESAIRSRNKYNNLFRSVLRNYGIQHEAEALSGAFTKLHCRFQERKDRNEIEKVIIGCVKQLAKSMKQEFHEEFQNSGDLASKEKAMLQKASAWYIVTYSDPEAKFLSFPWTVSQYLVNIKVKRTLANPIPFSPAILCMDDKIIECESKGLLPYCLETEIWHAYEFLADKLIVKRALQVLILWAQDKEVIETPGRNYQGLLYLDTFIKLFFFIAEKLHYVKRKGYNSHFTAAKSYSSGDLCLGFLKFCTSFRFCTKEEMLKVLPFHLYNYNKLSKRAVVSYHKFALTSSFETLYSDKKVEDIIEMKPIDINSKIFKSSPVNEASLRKAENELMKYSKVEDVSLREIKTTKKVRVSARGTEQAIKALKSILRKKDVVITQLFYEGILPESKID